MLRARIILASVSAWALVGGCSSYHSSSSTARVSSPAVQASTITRAPTNDQTHFALAYPTGDRKSSALLVEQIGPEEVRIGRETRAQLRVTNLTNRTLKGISLRPQVADGLSLTRAIAAPPAGANVYATTQPGDPNVYAVGDLGPNESRTIDVVAVPRKLGKVDACYAVTMEPQMLCTSLNVVNPTLRASAAGPAEADVCQELIYKYTVANAGTGTTHDVVLEERLPDGLMTTDGKNVVSAELGDIPQGQRREVTAHLRAQRTGTFATQADVRSRDDSLKTDIVSTTVRAPALAVGIKGPEQDYVGKAGTYIITVKNTGDAPARQAVVRVGTSEIGSVVAMNTVNANGAGGANDAQLASSASVGSGQDLGTLAPGETRQVQVKAQSNSGGVMSITAEASAACAVAAKQVVQTQILTMPALLLQANDEADPVRIGETVVYDVTVTNQGSGADSNIRVQAVLPDNVQFVSVDGATPAQANGRTITFAPVPQLDPKQSATWKVTAKVLRAGDVQFKATAVSDSVRTPAQKIEPTRLY